MTAACFRFYEELNDFLPFVRRKRDFDYDCADGTTIKHAIEALGVPHTEVELILANGKSVDFSYRVSQGDRISVYPKFEAFDIASLVRVRPQPLRVMRFTADCQLGGLARLLRMAGFDTLYDNRCADTALSERAREDGRVILTRDRELLKRRAVTHGCYVHATEPRAQFREIVERLQLAASARPFTLCLVCNLPLGSVAKDALHDTLPPRVASCHERFVRCPGCRRIYWEGSHWERMRGFLADVLRPGTLT